MKKEYVIYINIHTPFISERGNRLLLGEAWYTLNHIPEVSGEVTIQKHHQQANLYCEN